MSNKKILELILNSVGFEMQNYQINREGCLVAYEFEITFNNSNISQIAADSFEDAVRQTIEAIYTTDNVKF